MANVADSVITDVPPAPVLGWRGWIVKGSALYSPIATEAENRSAHVRWEEERQVARCLRGRRHSRVPAWACRCGLYAFHRSPIYQQWPSTLLMPRYVVGAVMGTGRVIIHRLAWRAERQRVLCTVNSPARILLDIPDFTSYAAAELYAKEWAQYAPEADEWVPLPNFWDRETK